MSQTAEIGGSAILTMRRMRIAWMAIGTAFLIFCLLCAGGVVGGIWYTSNVSEQHDAQLELWHGSSLQVKRFDVPNYVVPAIVSECQDNPSPVLCKETLSEGDSIRTGAGSDAQVQLFDGSTIYLNYDTEITIQRSRSSRFFNQFKDLVIHLERGSILVGTSSPYEYGSNPVQIVTQEHTRVHVHPNSVALVAVLQSSTGCGSLPVPCTQAIARLGDSDVITESANRVIRTQQDYSEMARVGADGTLRGPEQAQEELISNGRFQAGATDSAAEIAAGWRLGSQNSPNPGCVEIQTEASDSPDNVLPAARFVRPAVCAQGDGQTHEDVDRLVMFQEINRQVSVYKALQLNFFVKIVEQSEPGAGGQGRVYPLTVRLNYLDGEGKAQTWSRRFYFSSTPAKEASDPVEVVRGNWTNEEWEPLKDVSQITVINSIEFEASGYVYDVSVRGVSLLGR